MDFSNIVKDILSRNGMKNAELARKTGYSPQYISDLISGDRRWNEDSMNRVCEALNIEVNFHTSEGDENFQ